MFKGQEIEQGDIVTMRARSFPFEFQAAVVDYDKASDTLEVMSTQLVITNHTGSFPSSDVDQITVTHKYTEGLPLEARADLKRGQRCIVRGDSDSWFADVTAAFDGVVTGSIYDTAGVEDGTQVTGGSTLWQPQTA